MLYGDQKSIIIHLINKRVSANCRGPFQHKKHLLPSAVWLCLSTNDMNRRHHSSIGSVSVAAFNMESVFQLDHVFRYYSNTQTHKSGIPPPPPPLPPFRLQSEKILFIHQRRWSAAENGAATAEPPGGNDYQTYLSCRKTAAPPRRLPSPRLWPGRWAATCTCQSPAAPCLQGGSGGQ